MKILSTLIFFGVPALITFIELVIFSTVQAILGTYFGMPKVIVALFQEPLYTFPITMVLYIFTLIWWTMRLTKKPPEEDFLKGAI